MDKRTRRLLKKLAKNHRRINNDRITEDREDRLAESIIHSPRTMVEDDGENWKVYGYILPSDIFNVSPDNESEVWSDYLALGEKDISKFVEENMVVRIYSDWDCTGQPFTRWIDCHRNPNGMISYVHAMAIDI